MSETEVESKEIEVDESKGTEPSLPAKIGGGVPLKKIANGYGTYLPSDSVFEDFGQPGGLSYFMHRGIPEHNARLSQNFVPKGSFFLNQMNKERMDFDYNKRTFGFRTNGLGLPSDPSMNIYVNERNYKHLDEVEKLRKAVSLIKEEKEAGVEELSLEQQAELVNTEIEKHKENLQRKFEAHNGMSEDKQKSEEGQQLEKEIANLREMIQKGQERFDELQEQIINKNKESKQDEDEDESKVQSVEVKTRKETPKSESKDSDVDSDINKGTDKLSDDESEPDTGDLLTQPKVEGDLDISKIKGTPVTPIATKLSEKLINIHDVAAEKRTESGQLKKLATLSTGLESLKPEVENERKEIIGDIIKLNPDADTKVLQGLISKGDVDKLVKEYTKSTKSTLLRNRYHVLLDRISELNTQLYASTLVPGPKDTFNAKSKKKLQKFKKVIKVLKGTYQIK
jgi:hypothetical protein